MNGLKFEYKGAAIPKGVDVELEPFESPEQAREFATVCRLLAEQCEDVAEAMESKSNGQAAEVGDRLLTAEEAAPLLGVTVKALQRRRSLPFRKKVGHRTVRYSERGIRRWLERKTG